MEKLSLLEVNNMSEDVLRQTLRDIVIENQRAEREEAERQRAEEEAKAKEEEKIKNFFANKLKNPSPRFGN